MVDSRYCHTISNKVTKKRKTKVIPVANKTALNKKRPNTKIKQEIITLVYRFINKKFTGKTAGRQLKPYFYRIRLFPLHRWKNCHH